MEAARRIIHVDMDAFFAAIEQRDDPRLRGRPVVVGGSPEGRGVVSTCSYEARAYGIRSAMPAARARRLCPRAVFVRPDFVRYSAAAHALRAIFAGYTPLVEPLSLDEAFLDVTESRGGLPTATAVARQIRQRVAEELRLTCSAGVAPLKFVAKIASDLRKPDGLVVVPPQRVLAFIRPLPVRKLWSVGPATEARLVEVGLTTIGALADCPLPSLQTVVGEAHGAFLHHLATGHDDRPVSPEQEARSHSAETTFGHDLSDLSEIEAVLQQLAERVAGDLAADEHRGRTVTLKVRYCDFRTVGRSLTLPEPTADAALIAATAIGLLPRTEAGMVPVRLLGIKVAGLHAPAVVTAPPRQLWLPLEWS